MKIKITLSHVLGLFYYFAPYFELSLGLAVDKKKKIGSVSLWACNTRDDIRKRDLSSKRKKIRSERRYCMRRTHVQTYLGTRDEQM